MKSDMTDKALNCIICLLILCAFGFAIYIFLDEIKNWEPDPQLTTMQYSEHVKRARLLHDNY